MNEVQLGIIFNVCRFTILTSFPQLSSETIEALDQNSIADTKRLGKAGFSRFAAEIPAFRLIGPLFKVVWDTQARILKKNGESRPNDLKGNVKFLNCLQSRLGFVFGGSEFILCTHRTVNAN